MSKKGYFFAGLCISLFIPLGIYLQGYKFFSSTGRFEMWWMLLKWNWENGEFMTGLGQGILQVFMPVIQNEMMPLAPGQTKVDVAIWPHNDVLQLFVEQGFMGLTAYGCFYYQSLKKSWGRPKLLASLLSLFVFFFFNYPSHDGVAALLAALLFSESFRNHGQINEI